MNSYWKQKASPWVSISVLAGGLLSALILFFLVRVQSNLEMTAFNLDLAEQSVSNLGDRSR